MVIHHHFEIRVVHEMCEANWCALVNVSAHECAIFEISNQCRGLYETEREKLRQVQGSNLHQSKQIVAAVES